MTTEKRRRPRHRNRKQIARAEVLARRCVALRLGGASYPVIARRLGISTSSAYEAWKRGLAELCPVEDLVEERQRSRLILDGLREKIQKRLARANCPLAAFDTAVRIEQRVSQLLGLDSAIEFDVNLQGRPANADELTAKIQKNLTVEQQRVLVQLLRLAQNGAPVIETTAQTVQTGTVSPAPAETAVEIARAMVAPPSVTCESRPMPPPTPTVEPEPSRAWMDDRAWRAVMPEEDPASGAGRQWAERTWMNWHTRICTFDAEHCPHYAKPTK
jgi:hypothetical protein